ncbi:hypothetical protein Pan44_01730 [Caulifigura coniformis]|uniref:Uncharacterized protein n=2 Tax=Caulifigura coniformis TaxID=2527983 RepID=A0A517S7T0_9PLAN|nr:hypothetical protein Pan44_01730 [Caulifigura coniformis]
MPVDISDRVLAGCWFEWHRQGGCGAGEVRLRDDFADRGEIEPGDWISMESGPGLRWYLGRVETKEAAYPAGVRLRLEGMGVELGEVYPGGFGSDADGVPPQRLGATDLFSLDPDRDLETFDATGDAASVVRLLLSRYVEPAAHITYAAPRVEDSLRPAGVESLKVRGEESARSLIKELAVRAGASSWGVDAAGEFFFLQRRTSIELVLQIGQNVSELEELSDRELLFNRLLLTGDYVYDRADDTDNIAVRSYRWRGNYVEPVSRAAYGERRLRLWIPWIRTQADAVSFSREFFRTYSQPRRRYRVTTGVIDAPVFPWLGAVRLKNAAGFDVATGICDVIRVRFDRVPRMELEIGPEDPRNLWPEPAQDERWELPARSQARGGNLSLTSLTDPWTDGGGGGDSGGSDASTTDTGGDTSLTGDASVESSMSGLSDLSSFSDGLTTEEGTSLTTDSNSDPESSGGSSSDPSDESGDASTGGAGDSDESSDFVSDGSGESSLDSDASSDESDGSDASSS